MKVFSYPRQINDWRRKTAKLPLEQRGAYSELVDWYYALDAALPNDLNELCRMLGAIKRSERESIKTVISNPELFSVKDGFLVQNMCDETLANIAQKSFDARASAEAKWRKNKGLPYANASRPHSDGNANHKPKDIEEDKGANAPSVKVADPLPPLFDKFWEAYPKARRDSKNKSLPAYRKALTRTTEEVIYEAVIRYAGSDEVARGFAKGTIAWLNADRWTVDYRSPAPQGQTVNGKSSYGNSIKNAARAVYDLLDEEDRVRAEAN